MKSFSTVRDTRRGTQSYMEKRKGRKEREVARRIKGGIKRRETDLASNQFPKCSSQPRTHKERHLLEKKESQKGKRAIKPVILLPSKNGY